MRSVRGFGVILLAMLFLLASCQSQQPGKLTVTDMWGRPAAAGGNGAVYFVVDNATDQADTLLKAECDAAENVELHMSSMDESGKMSMQPQEKVEIPAGQKTEFKPGGLHVMLINLKNDLSVGQKINVTLTFENAGEVSIEVPIQEP